MNVKPQLVLDMGGVLVTNLSPLLWEQLASRGQVPYDALVGRYKQEIRDHLWNGVLAEEQFWEWLGRHVPDIDRNTAKAMLRSNLQPLPALSCLEEWSRLADIHLLSNHRTEWVASTLEGIRDYVKSVTISDSVGFCKPHPAIYEAVAAHLGGAGNVLFVDDQEKNLRHAEQLGWNTLLADAQGAWIGKIPPFLGK